jgi:hypothetical protein
VDEDVQDMLSLHVLKKEPMGRTQKLKIFCIHNAIS